MTKLCFQTAKPGLHRVLAVAAHKHIISTIDAAQTRPGRLTRSQLADLLGIDRNQLRRWLTALNISLP